MTDNRRHLISHPGEVLREEFLEPFSLSVYALSKAMGVPRTRMNDIILGRRGISADTALRLARFFDMTPDYWLNLQTHYDLVMAETNPENTLAAVRPFREIRPEDAPQT